MCSWCWPDPALRHNDSGTARNAGPATQGHPTGAVQVVEHLTEAPCVASTPARSQTSRMLLAGDSSSADENGQAGAHVVNGSHDRPHRTIVVSHGHSDGHRQCSLRLGNCAAEGSHGDIGTEVDDFEAAAAQDVRSHGGREPVLLVGRSPQDHAAALGPPHREARSQSGHDPRCHTRSPMLVVDGVLTGLPALANRSHGLAQPVQQDLVGIRPRTQAALDDRPGPWLVTRDESILQPARRRAAREARWVSARGRPVTGLPAATAPRSRGSTRHCDPMRRAGRRPVRT